MAFAGGPDGTLLASSQIALREITRELVEGLVALYPDLR